MARCPRCGTEILPSSRFCGACGTPLAVPAPPPGVILPRKNDHVAVIVILVVVLVVAVPVVASAVLYVMVSGLLQPPPGQNVHPTMSLVLSGASSTGADILVAGSVPSPSPAYLKVNIQVNMSFGTAVTFPASSGSTVDVMTSLYSAPFMVRWTDADGDGLVSAGDLLGVTYPTGLAGGSQVQFYLIWSDGSAITTLAWNA